MVGCIPWFDLSVSTVTIDIRPARARDAAEIAAVHDDAWLFAYRGLIPGAELQRMVMRRGAAWWQKAIAGGSRLSLLTFGPTIAGYANYGRNRARALSYDGEIYELYLRPEFHGLGLGRKLFEQVRRELGPQGSLVVWALADNHNANGFYRALGGVPVARSSESFGQIQLDKVAYGWQA